MAAISVSARRPSPRLAELAPLVWAAAAEGPAEALIGDRARAAELALTLDEVSRHECEALARLARHGASRIRRALGHLSRPAFEVVS